MTDYWVANKKYWCRACETYIADNAPSRQQHESGLRHKGNMERYMRSVFKEGERRNKEHKQEMREMERVERAAQAAYANDLSAGYAKATAPSTSSRKTSTSIAVPSRHSDPYANYSTAQSLGYTDPDAERQKAVVERRRTQGVVGEWEVVEPASPPEPDLKKEAEETHTPTEDVVAGVKRQREEDDADRSWKLTKKKVDVGLGEIYDPGIIPIKTRARKVEKKVEDPS